jgi:hypothetical protein
MVARQWACHSDEGLMKITRIASKKEITPEVIRQFINQFDPQLPGLRKYYNDQLFLKYTADMFKVFSNANNFISFMFQFQKWLEKYDPDKDNDKDKKKK